MKRLFVWVSFFVLALTAANAFAEDSDKKFFQCRATIGARESVDFAILLGTNSFSDNTVIIEMKRFVNNGFLNAYLKDRGVGKNTSNTYKLDSFQTPTFTQDPIDGNYLNLLFDLGISEDDIAVGKAAKNLFPSFAKLQNLKLNTANPLESKLEYAGREVSMRCFTADDFKNIFRMSELAMAAVPMALQAQLLAFQTQVKEASLAQAQQNLSDLIDSALVISDTQKIFSVSEEALKVSIEELKKNKAASKKTIKALQDKLDKLREVNSVYGPANAASVNTILLSMEDIKQHIENLTQAAAELKKSLETVNAEIAANAKELKRLENRYRPYR